MEKMSLSPAKPNQSILITGASGVLGKLLLEAVRQRGYYVYALSSRKEQLASHYAADPDVCCIDWNELRSDILSKGTVETVFHCAFARSQKASDLAKSIELAGKLFSWCVENEVKRVINISSQSIYGGYREIPSHEDGPIAPLDAYASAKLTCEFLGNYATRGSSTAITHVRLASLIGPQFDERLVNKMLHSAIHKGTLTVFGGLQQFSFLDVRDAVSGLLAMLDSDPLSWKKVYNLGTEERLSLMQIAEVIAKLSMKKTGRSVSINREEADIQTKIALDCSRFQKDFGWRAKIDFEHALLHILENCK